MKNIGLILWLIFLSGNGCTSSTQTSKFNSFDKEKKINDWRNHWEKPDEKDEIIRNKQLNYRIRESLKDSNIIVLTGTLKADLIRYNQVKSLGDIDSDGTMDSIVLIPELFITEDSSYENGASVLFMNREIPRIRVDVPCLELDFIFAVEDIDEDGIIELGKYYTSCVSRFKSLELISLKNHEWEPIGQVLFDTWYKEPNKEKRIKKLSKGKFAMREISGEEGKKIDKWIEFKLE